MKTKDNNSQGMNKVLSFCLVVFTLSLAYYLVIFLPKKHNDDQVRQHYTDQTIRECSAEFDRRLKDGDIELTAKNGIKSINDAETARDMFLKSCVERTGLKY